MRWFQNFPPAPLKAKIASINFPAAVALTGDRFNHIVLQLEVMHAFPTLARPCRPERRSREIGTRQGATLYVTVSSVPPRKPATHFDRRTRSLSHARD